MAGILEQVRVLVEQAIRSLGYPGVALVMFLENIFPPIPSELVMPLAGFLVDRGEMSFVGVLAAGTLGAVLGAAVIYSLGLKVGESRVRTWFQEYGAYFLMSEDDFDRALDKFEGNGKKVVLLGRLIPGARSLISLPAGLERMNQGQFLVLTTIGTVIWNVILTAAGFLLGRNWQKVLGIIDTYELIVWLSLGILIAVFIARRKGKLGSEVF